MQRYCFALDLKEDETLIREYLVYHEKVWPEILDSITGSGITQMEIYRVSNRLFMIMETSENFSFESKEAADASSEKVQEWETLMWKYQEAIPGGKPGEKWRLMNRIFDLQAALK
ncbi:MAG: L-rhamnose mutarotase [Chitinophagaceae bacterium]|nr:L-rhamnose mutarotase [Chitinophagaceae bacterium]MBP6589490.1 L-rhamnose mutarotase [Chitinophagaceae bacterium]MBP8243811.1 L-rhamnose mutarotase [Chitinophagaceae bacterium]